MSTTTTREQERWNEIVSDPLLSELPYKVETNAQGQIILSSHTNRHSKAQRSLQKLLDRHAPTGEVYPEFVIATAQGVKSPDVVWGSPKREREMEEKRALTGRLEHRRSGSSNRTAEFASLGRRMEESTLVPESPDQV